MRRIAGIYMTWILSALIMLYPMASSAQDIQAGGSATFLTNDGDTEKVGDVFGEVAWDFSVSSKNYLQIAALGGFGEAGQGFLGLGARHFWGVKDGVYPAIGAHLFYLNGGDLNLGDTSVFVGPEISLELLSDAYPWSIRPFAAYYPSVTGADASIFRFGIAVNEIGDAGDE